MEKITFLTDDNENVMLYILEETRINGTNYILVTDSDDETEDAECYILKDTSSESDKEASYEMVSDEEELNAVGSVFDELLEDVDIQ